MSDTAVQLSGQAQLRTARPRQRRGTGPLSGLMIVCGLLLMGSSVAIPASQAMQEANMRSRIAAMTARAEQTPPERSFVQIPAVIERDDDEDNDSAEGVSSNAGSVAEPDPTDMDDDPINEAVNVQPDNAVEEVATQPRPPSPTYIRAPAVGIDAQVIEVGYQVVEHSGQRIREWDVAAYAAGHHFNSARPGEQGNIVITGHNDWEGEVFRNLEYIEIGHEIFVTTEASEHRYVVTEIHLRREVNVSIEERLATGAFISPMPEERLTLITCWPYGINDHRVIVVAHPEPLEVSPPDLEQPVS